MCTRTKTSYGCGCAPKRTVNCGSSSCTGVDARYHLFNEGDCPECKRGGDRVTRGREGKGRYAMEIKARGAAPPVTRPPLSPLSTNIPANPWAPPRPREKEWHSPVRKRADEAWLEEHERRQRDLDAKSSQNSPRPSHSSPAKDHARDHKRGNLNMAKLENEVRRTEEAQRVQVRRRAERSNSYDSFPSMDSSLSPPRGRTFDSGFHHSSSSYLPKMSSHHGLGRGLAITIRDSARPRSRW